jgi:hypothetical protein
MDSLTPQFIDLIGEQPMFFVATAAAEGRVNVSPKGMDTLRIDAPDRIRWLNLSGSGNETAAHVAATGRMTLMWSSFTKMPMTLRVYGTAFVVHPRDEAWGDVVGDFLVLAGSRQVFDLAVDHVATSCGTGVPMMSLDAVRADEELEPFYAAMSDEELQDYWSRKNTESIDGLPTNIFG